MSMHRYAVYFAPASTHPLWHAGCSLLGRDPEANRPIPQPTVAGITTARLAEVTAGPARYGWHGTLKPPFALADGTDAAELDAALGDLARVTRGFAMPPLALACLSGFIAVVPAAPSPDLDGLAATCVRRFDRFRRPPDPAELARRRHAGLTPEEERNLAEWGYPYVMDRFRFHMTITGRLDTQAQHATRDALAPHLAAALAEPLRADGIALYAEPAAGEPFILLRRYAFSA